MILIIQLATLHQKPAQNCPCQLLTLTVALAISKIICSILCLLHNLLSQLLENKNHLFQAHKHQNPWDPLTYPAIAANKAKWAAWYHSMDCFMWWLKWLNKEHMRVQWLKKPSQCFVVLDRLAWCEKMTYSRVLILMYIKLHLLGFIDHVIACDLHKNPWGNEQNNIETHWDSFVSIYYFAV